MFEANLAENLQAQERALKDGSFVPLYLSSGITCPQSRASSARWVSQQQAHDAGLSYDHFLQLLREAVVKLAHLLGRNLIHNAQNFTQLYFSWSGIALTLHSLPSPA